MAGNISNGIYTQRLLSLPIIQSLKDLAFKTRLPLPLLSKYIRNNSKYYNHILMKKKSGGLRPIDSPNKELKAIQRWILKNILSCLRPSPFATGFIPKKSILDNALPHTGNQYILSIDLKNFFTTVKASHVYAVFISIGYSKKTAYALTSICTLNGSLPQGAPTSPCLSNLVCLRLDHRIAKYCENKALIFTRYADDICISGNKLSVIKKAWDTIRIIISDENYTINSKKEMLSGPRGRREVTGLVVTPKLGIGRLKYNFYRKEIVNHLKKNPTEISSEILGILSYVRSVDLEKYKKLNDFYQKKLFCAPI